MLERLLRREHQAWIDMHERQQVSMTFVRWVFRAFCTTAIVVAGTNTVFSLAVACFIVTGTLQPGEPMSTDGATPTLGSTLLIAAVSAAIIAAVAPIRQKLARAKPS